MPFHGNATKLQCQDPSLKRKAMQKSSQGESSGNVYHDLVSRTKVGSSGRLHIYILKHGALNMSLKAALLHFCTPQTN
mgnify:FL=1